MSILPDPSEESEPEARISASAELLESMRTSRPPIFRPYTSRFGSPPPLSPTKREVFLRSSISGSLFNDGTSGNGLRLSPLMLSTAGPKDVYLDDPSARPITWGQLPLLFRVLCVILGSVFILQIVYNFYGSFGGRLPVYSFIHDIQDTLYTTSAGRVAINLPFPGVEGLEVANRVGNVSTVRVAARIPNDTVPTMDMYGVSQRLEFGTYTVYNDSALTWSPTANIAVEYVATSTFPDLSRRRLSALKSFSQLSTVMVVEGSPVLIKLDAMVNETLTSTRLVVIDNTTIYGNTTIHGTLYTQHIDAMSVEIHGALTATSLGPQTALIASRYNTSELEISSTAQSRLVLSTPAAKFSWQNNGDGTMSLVQQETIEVLKVFSNSSMFAVATLTAQNLEAVDQVKARSGLIYDSLSAKVEVESPGTAFVRAKAYGIQPATIAINSNSHDFRMTNTNSTVTFETGGITAATWQNTGQVDFVNTVTAVTSFETPGTFIGQGLLIARESSLVTNMTSASSDSTLVIHGAQTASLVLQNPVKQYSMRNFIDSSFAIMRDSDRILEISPDGHTYIHGQPQATNGGNIVIEAGAGATVANNGFIQVGVLSTSAVTIAASTIRTTIQGPQTVLEAMTLGYSADPDYYISRASSTGTTGADLYIQGQTASTTGGNVIIEGGGGSLLSNAGVIQIGVLSTSGISLGATNIRTTIQGPQTVLEAMTLGYSGDTDYIISRAASTDATGTDFYLRGQSAAITGGNVIIEAGSGSALSNAGVIQIGVLSTSAVTIAASTVRTTIQGPQTVLEAMTLGYSADTDYYIARASSTGATGSHLYIQGQAASTTGGNVIIEGGGGSVLSNTGIIQIGVLRTSGISVAATNVRTTIQGPQTVLEAMTLGYSGDADYVVTRAASTGATGSHFYLRGQSAASTGGNVIIEAGGGSILNTAGVIQIGMLSTSGVTVAETNVRTTIQGPQTVMQEMTLGYPADPDYHIKRADTLSSTGTDLYIHGQTAYALGGDVLIDGGAGATATDAGTVTIGSGTTSGVTLGKTGTTVNVVDLLTTARLSSSGAVTATTFVGAGVSPIGSILAHYVDIANADSLAIVRAQGWAFCDGTTPADQGITNPVILSTPNLIGYFLRGTTPGQTGTFQADAFQGHIHTMDAQGSHSHSMGSAGDHTHSYSSSQFSTLSYYSDYSDASVTYAYGSSTISSGTAGAHIHTLSTDGSHAHTITNPTSDGVNGAPRTDTETRPQNFKIVWIMRVR